MANTTALIKMYLAILGGCVLVSAPTAHASDEAAATQQESPYGKDLDYLSLTLEELGKIKISIATGSETSIEQAPAVATVITSDDIEALGLHNLDEVLQIVPGLHVSVSPITYTPIYTFRGIRSNLNNPQILMLVNGIPITSVFSGDRGVQWGGYPVEHIARVEIIRGPGSALYGADAYAGVINIVTKTVKDLTGNQAGIRGGSFNSSGAWMIGGGNLGSIEATGYLSVGTTDGQSEIIQSDAQTVNDGNAAPPTNASLAPGPVSTGYDSLDGHFDLSGKEWRFRSSLNIREDLGTGAGGAQALDPSGTNPSLRWSSDLTYSPIISNSNWKPEVQASAMYYREKSDLVLYPPGTDLGGGVLSDGFIRQPAKWERHYRVNISTLYTGFEKHNTRMGTGYSSADLYKISETSGVPLFIEPQKRTLKYLFLQDEWNFNANLALTTGIRYDNYSDFGNTTNPRLALVWKTSDTITTKLLYGEAFRAPAFNELYAVNNPVITGNPKLKPETINTSEAALLWQASPTFSLGTNIFHYRMEDIIRYVQEGSSAIADNIGEQKGQGVEFEFAWDPTKKLRVQGNYTYQESTDDNSNQDAGLAPENMIHLRGDWRFTQHWAANIQLNWVADRQREPNDTRQAIDDYTTVNLALRTTNPNNDWKFTLSLLNIFDEDVFEPSPGPSALLGANTLIEYDLPMAGRSVFGRLSYQF